MSRLVTVLALFSAVAALQACSRSQPASPDGAAASPTASSTATQPETTPQKADGPDLRRMQDLRADLAPLVAGSYGEHCNSSVGKGFPDVTKGFPMTFSPQGVLSWADQSLDLVKTPGMKLYVTRMSQGKTFTFNFESIQAGTGARLHIGSVSQNGSVPGATLTDSSKAPDDTSKDLGYICMSSKAPQLETQSLWAIAAKHLKVPRTTMSCSPLGKFDFQELAFEFDGQEIKAGDQVFHPGDAWLNETISVDPHDDHGLVFTFTKADESSVTLALDGKGQLSFSQLRLGKGRHLACSPKS